MSEIKSAKTECTRGFGSNQKSKRRVKVSKQRQVSIPKDFYKALGFEDEAIMEFNGNEILIRPAPTDEVDFSEDILKDLISKGFSGQELLEEFRRIKAKIPAALRALEKDTERQPEVAESLGDYLDSLEDDEADE